MKTFQIISAQGTQYVSASSKSAASIKFTGMRPTAAIKLGQIESIKRVEG
jgi:hypothetical protein